METPILDIWSPDPGDDYALTQDLAAMADDIEDAILNDTQITYVANVAARTALVNQRTLEGRPPSTTRPLFVFRGDALDRDRLEYTRDGVTWEAVRGKATRMGNTVWVGTTAGVTVTFPTGFFGSVPAVTATPYNNPLVSVAHISDITNTGFLLRLYTLAGNPTTGGCSWAATQPGAI